MVFHAQNRAQWPMLHKLDLIGVVKIPMLSLEIGIDIPGVPLFRLVPEGLQEIPADGLPRASRVCFRSRQRLVLLRLS